MIKRSQNIRRLILIATLMLLAFSAISSCYADNNGPKDKLEEIMSLMESASVDQDHDKIFMALDKYYEAFKRLNDINKESPDSKRVELLLFLVKEKIRECKQHLNTAISKMDREVFGIEARPVNEKRRVVSGRVNAETLMGYFIGCFAAKKHIINFVKSFWDRLQAYIRDSVPRFKKLFISSNEKTIQLNMKEETPVRSIQEKKMPEKVTFVQEMAVSTVALITPLKKEAEEKTDVVEEKIDTAEPIEEVKAKEAKNEEAWIVTKKSEKAHAYFDGYHEDSEVKFYLDEEQLGLDKPILRKADEMWVALDAILSKMGAMLLKTSEDGFIVIRSDGTPLEFKAEDAVVKVNKSPFLTLDQAPRIYSGSFMISVDSLAKMLDISYSFDSSNNTVKFSRRKVEEFSTFSVPKPVVPLEKKPKPPEAKPLPPPDIREELLPPEYRRNIDLKIDTTWSYLKDEAAHDRTRQADWYLSGKTYDYTVDGHVRMRDFRTTQKQRLKQDGEFLGLYGENLWFKVFDNYIRIPQLRSQSDSYFGTEITHFYDPLKTTFMAGEIDNTVSGPTSVGAVRYLGDMYAIRQEYTDIHNLFRVGGMILHQESEAETQGKSSTTTYPRRGLLYVLDSTVYLYRNLNLYYAYALSNYVPDNKVNAHFQDDDWRAAISLDENLYSFKTSYEHVGNQYASVGVPTTYQDYEGLDFGTTFKFAPNWSSSLSGRANRNNVERDPRLPTNFNRSLSASTAFSLPWQQNLNLSYAVTESTTEGDEIDLSGNRYRDYRIDYTKVWNNLTAQMSYDYYILKAFGTATGGSFTDSYSTTLFQFFPSLNNSYLRLYQDMRKTKTIASASYTTTFWNTDIGTRLNVTNYLSGSGDLRIATTQREAFKDTALVTLILGTEFRSSPVTIWDLTYTLSNYDLYDPENQTTKHYTILFKVRHMFDIATPDKWGAVKASVFRDLNSNGKHDVGEPGIPNIRINVVDGRAAYTNAAGIAVIQKVVPGNRKVKIDLSKLPLEMAVRGAVPTQSVAIEPLRSVAVEFPIVSTGKLKGRFYVDIDKNGVYDKKVDEVLQNVRVYIIPAGKDTLTFSDGSYYFDYVYPGEHEIAVDLATVSPDYKLSSPDKIKVSLKEGETLTDLNFLFSPKPIVIEQFDKK